MKRSHKKEMESNIEVLYSGASPEFFLGLAAKMLEEGEAKESPAEKPNVMKINMSKFQNRETHRDEKRKKI